MSRSFHTTRRHLKEAEELSCSNEEKRAESIEKLKEDLEKKRRTKWQVLEQRKEGESIVPPTPIETIPIEICDDSKYLHFPADAEDLRGLLNIMPCGIADGLKKICLCLGADSQDPPEESWAAELEVDPYLGRGGYEFLSGIYIGRCVGTYSPYKAEIWLHGYVYSPDLANRAMLELYLRLHMLMVFIHEIGHHHDFTFRIARGRWRGDNPENVEIYAETMQHKWLTDYIIPFLQTNYSQEFEELNSWVKVHAGVEVPIETLIGDPRCTAKDGMIVLTSFFDTGDAFRSFVNDVLAGKDLIETRLRFANDLHMAEKYDLALKIIELVLSEKPNNVEAITLKADIYTHLEKYDLAIQLAENSLSIQQDYVPALDIIVDAYAGLKDWRNVITASDALLNILDDEDICEQGDALCSKGNAYIQMGHNRQAKDIIEELEKGEKWSQRMARELREALDQKLE